MSLLPGSPNSLPPIGLLGLFGIKSQGATPKPYDGLQLTFDALPFYVRGQETATRFSNSAAAIGVSTLQDAVSAANLVVPSGKCWLVTGAFARATTTAAQYLRGRLVASAPTNGGNVEIINLTDELNSSLQGAVGAAYAVCGWPPGQDATLLGPGCGLHLVTSQLTAGPVTVTGAVRYYEFPY